MFKRMLICLLCLALLVPSALAETPTLRILGWVDMDGYTDAQIEMLDGEASFDEIANAIAIRNDQVDLFILPAYSGLYSLKKHGYYTSLDDSEVLTARLGDLYPAFQDALTDDEGHLVGWIVSCDLIGMNVYTATLEENDIPIPSSFGEMLDACKTLLETDALPSDQSLMGYTGYTRQSVLDLYMTLYVRSGQLNGGTVDFTAPAFKEMVERIRTELPEKDPFKGDYPDWAVFELDRGYMELEEGMVFLPPVTADKPSAIEAWMTIAVINPYSANQDAAVALLEWYAQRDNVERYVYDASATEPVMNKGIVEEIETMQAEIARLEAIADPTADQADELTRLREECARLERYRWRVSAETIAQYREQTDGLCIAEASPVTYDEALQTAAKRFLSGAFDVEGFAKECQNHITMIYLENGISMN
ncbi:MAG: hypothetical protein J1E43_10320 [Christensenellaceae bacterium]|nr:hypothetical protein [Christensenellaceae bacterium]